MGGNACDDVFDWAAREPDRAMFAAKADGAWQPVAAERFADRVTAVTADLIAAGIEPGDRIGLMPATSRWPGRRQPPPTRYAAGLLRTAPGVTVTTMPLPGSARGSSRQVLSVRPG